MLYTLNIKTVLMNIHFFFIRKLIFENISLLLLKVVPNLYSKRGPNGVQPSAFDVGSFHLKASGGGAVQPAALGVDSVCPEASGSGGSIQPGIQ